MKLISLKRTKEDKRGDKMETAPMEAIEPDYPWGACIHLDKDELDKLGMKNLPEIGSEMMLQAKIKVTRVSQSAAAKGTEGYDEQISVDFQITDMAIG